MPFSHILVATDFSETSLTAVRAAVKLAKESNTKLTILHVGSTAIAATAEPAAWTPSAGETLLRMHEQMAAAQWEALRTLAANEVPPGLEHRVLSREGYPPTEIIAAANEGNCDLIVVGTHGRTGVERVFLGSVAGRVLRTSKVPVLVTH